ncbi:MAG: hypothetical protein IJ558_08720 [Treponema sp.]|nr:hypothetical protein [Treponema sp.]
MRKSISNFIFIGIIFFIFSNSLLFAEKTRIQPLKTDDVPINSQNVRSLDMFPMPNGQFFLRKGSRIFLLDSTLSVIEHDKNIDAIPFSVSAMCEKGIYYVDIYDSIKNWNQIWFYDFEKKVAKRILHYDESLRITHIASSADGSVLAVADEQGKTYFEDVAHQNSPWWFGDEETDKNDVQELCVSPMGNSVFIVGNDGTTILTADSETYWKIPDVRVSSFSKKGNYVSLSGRNSTFICKIGEEGFFREYKGRAFQSAFSLDEKYFARVTFFDNEWRMKILIDGIDTGIKKEIVPLDSYVSMVFFSNDGTKIITLNSDGVLRSYSIETGGF